MAASAAQVGMGGRPALTPLLETFPSILRVGENESFALVSLFLRKNVFILRYAKGCASNWTVSYRGENATNGLLEDILYVILVMAIN